MDLQAIDLAETHGRCETRGDGASTDSRIDRPRNVPWPHLFVKLPHRITKPTPIRLARATPTFLHPCCFSPFFSPLLLLLLIPVRIFFLPFSDTLCLSC